MEGTLLEPFGDLVIARRTLDSEALVKPLHTAGKALIYLAFYLVGTLIRQMASSLVLRLSRLLFVSLLFRLGFAPGGEWAAFCTPFGLDLAVFGFLVKPPILGPFGSVLLIPRGYAPKKSFSFRWALAYIKSARRTSVRQLSALPAVGFGNWHRLSTDRSELCLDILPNYAAVHLGPAAGRAWPQLVISPVKHWT